jgi:hypothetical protein
LISKRAPWCKDVRCEKKRKGSNGMKRNCPQLVGFSSSCFFSWWKMFGKKLALEIIRRPSKMAFTQMLFFFFTKRVGRNWPEESYEDFPGNYLFLCFWSRNKKEAPSISTKRSRSNVKKQEEPSDNVMTQQTSIEKFEKKNVSRPPQQYHCTVTLSRSC